MKRSRLASNLRAAARSPLLGLLFAAALGPAAARADLVGGAFVPGLSPPPGTNGVVDSLLSFDDGSGPALFLGGDFTRAGDVAASGIARFGDGIYGALGSGLDGRVRALVAFDDGTGPALFAGGDFGFAGSTRVAHVAKWDGAAWSPLGLGTDGSVHAFAVHDDGTGVALYAGGDFLTAGGQPALRVARWSRGEWSAVGDGFDGGVRALESFQDGAARRLVAGGSFLRSGAAPRSRLAAWNGRRWAPLLGGVDDEVLALATYDDGPGPALFIGGRFSVAGNGVHSPRVVRLDRHGFRSVGFESSTPEHFVAALEAGSFYGHQNLFAVGYLRFGTGYRTGLNAAIYNLSRWIPVGNFFYPTVDNALSSIALHDDGEGPMPFVGGGFTSEGGTPAHHLARLGQSGEWGPVTSGVGGPVRGIARFDAGDGAGPATHVAGDFTSALGGPAERVARWNGSGFEPLASGPVQPVHALLAFDAGSGSRLFAAGTFYTAGGVGANGLARSDGSTWSAVDAGTIGPFHDLVLFDDGRGSALYAAGTNVVQRFDGAGLETLPNDVNPFTSLAVFDDGGGPDLYAGRAWSGYELGNVSRFDGNEWVTIGLANGPVWAVASLDDGSGPALFAGGAFTTIGGVDCAHIARFDGSAWAPLGTGVDGTVLTLAVYDPGSGPVLVAGGQFLFAGGSAGAFVASWDGSGWSQLGTGLDGPAYRIVALEAVPGGDGIPELWIGGNFATAGGIDSAFVACWKNPLATALAGTVGRRRGPPAPVLFVSGSTGDRNRCVELLTHEPLSIFMDTPPGAGAPAPFALYAWTAKPDASTLRTLPRGIGTIAMPPPLSGGSGEPRVVWNNTGRVALGAPTRSSAPAPSLVFSRPSGTGRAAAFFLQGIIHDADSAAEVETSVTNGLRVEIR